MIIDELRRLAAEVPGIRPDPSKAWGPSDALSNICIYERARAEFWRAAYEWQKDFSESSWDYETDAQRIERKAIEAIIAAVREREGK